MEIILVVMLWEISLIFAFFAGLKFKKPKAQSKEHIMTEEEKKAFKRLQKEQANFMAYDGTPQEDINDF